MKSFSAMWSDKLGKAIEAAAPVSYAMSLITPDEKEAVTSAVNQGIDSYLEACYIKERGDSYEFVGNRMECRVSKESLPVLIRRLMNLDGEWGTDLASGICGTLDIELV
jgi:hypothetical protein